MRKRVLNDSHGVPEDIADVVKDINDGMYSLNVDDGDGNLQLSVTQSQSVDGTEPVTQAEDVPMQLQLEDERIRKKKYEFQKRKELEWRQKAACVQESDVDVAKAPKCTNLMQTRLTQVFDRDGVKEKKVVLKRKMSDRNPDGTQRRSPCVKAGSQPGNSKADADSVVVKIGPSKLGGSPVRRSPRGLINKKPSSSPLQERSLLKENRKRKVHPAKVNKGVKKHARVKAEDVVSEEDDIEVDSEDEFAVPVSVMIPVKPVEGNAGKAALDEDSDTLTLDMGEANKKLCITSDRIQQLFGFPRGGRSAPRPSEDGYDDALMKLSSELDISRNKDIKTNDLRNKLKVLVKDPSKDDLALKVFFIIVFMKVVLPGSAPRVSREVAMFEGLVFEDMANMDYCQLMVDELRRVIAKYQDGDTMGKAITGCAIGPVLMYLDCLIRGKTTEPDMRVPRICFMDPAKLSDLVDADLIKQGNADPKTWVFGKLPVWFFSTVVSCVVELNNFVQLACCGKLMRRFFRVHKRPVLEMPSPQVPKFSSLPDELRDGRGVEGAGYVPPGPSHASASQRQGFGIDVAVSALERTKHILSNVCSELQKVPKTVEHMSCVNGILPEGHQFNVEEAVDYIEMEIILIGDMRDGATNLVQSSVRLLNNMKRFRTMQNSRCKAYEESANVVIKQFEQDEAAATDSRAGVGTEANVFDHETNDVGLEHPDVDIDQDEAAGTDSRADDGTEANVSDQHMNDVCLQHPVVDGTSHNVEAVVDRGVNDPSTDKCKGPIVGDEPCLPVGDVALNVSSSKIDDVAVNASKLTDVEREVVLSGGDDARGVPLSSRRNVGNKVADEDDGAASILDAKSPGVGIVGNENVPNCEDLPPENFPPGGLDYGDALQDASSVEEVSSEDNLLLSISSDPSTQEALLSSQDFLSTDPESAAILVSSQVVPSSNPETGGIMVSSQELPSSSNPDSPESGNVVKVDTFFFAATRLRTNRTKCHKPMFQNKECDASVGSIAKAFIPTGMLNSDNADIVLYSLCQKYRDTDKLIVPRWVTTKIRDGNIDSNVLNWFTRSGEWLDLGEHDYRFFGSQFSELERVAIDLSQGRSLEKTRSGVMKGRLGALRGSTDACAKSPTTPKNPIVELIDSDDDVFDKIAGIGRVTRSSAAKGLSPLAGIVARRAGGARKDPALDSGNVVSTKRAPRDPIKCCSPMQQVHPHKFPLLDKACKLYNLLLSDEWREKYAENTFSMIPQPDESVTNFTENRIWEVFSPGQMMEGDVMDFLIDDWKQDPNRNADFASGTRILLSPYFITAMLDCSFYDDENKVFNVESAARDFKSYVKDKEDLLSADLIMMPLFKPMVLAKDKKVNHYSLYVMNRYQSSVDILDSLPYSKKRHPSKNTYHKDCEKIPCIVDWNAEDIYRVVFNRNNNLLVTELPKEVQALAPDA
ncbi:hypothetical protein VPH35_050389 [Triticum aestivum]